MHIAPVALALIVCFMNFQHVLIKQLPLRYPLVCPIPEHWDVIVYSFRELEMFLVHPCDRYTRGL
jgi:hypothetical protein